LTPAEPYRLLGLDLGGTNVKVAVVEIAPGGDPQVVAEETHPTHAALGPAAVVSRLVEIGAVTIARHGPVAGAGIGTPGVFDPAAGTVLLFPNLPGPWAGQPLRDPVAAGLGVPVTLINDARAFTLAEGTVGAGKGCDTLVCLTLGTGVGGGLMIGGRLHVGTYGRGGEIGHQIVIPDGPRCGCGAYGCVEAVTRADVLAALAARNAHNPPTHGRAAELRRCPVA
jgi:glucokinase